MEEILYLARHLVQINRRELVALEIVDQVEHDLIALKKSIAAKIPAELTLGNSYKNEIRRRIFNL